MGVLSNNGWNAADARQFANSCAKASYVVKNDQLKSDLMKAEQILNALARKEEGKAMREAREYMEDQKLGDFQLLDLIPHTPNETTKEALRESRGGNVDRVVDET